MIKIAFASKDGLHVDEHFGWCEKFYIYGVNEESYELLNEVDSSLKYEQESDKLEYKIMCIDGSDIVYVAKIGPKAASMVKLAGTFPLRSSQEDEKIEEVLKSIQKLMKENPPLWLKRILLK
ncbi:NifB/NifX family molybdenum-iron cluster-binding protein [Candidatus Sulfurimonas baltica]|uniref:NifB/NifX family molybdenum-iron cluster-binding protein n=1 Tax=Candidatus Sulfurimonas baltica TaxID=2740404 RepID=UPI001E319217|nr:NifB/NifX family molybdenum-iron cluster-binding protein [Candidatus Sulfurimonas baltica]